MTTLTCFHGDVVMMLDMHDLFMPNMATVQKSTLYIIIYNIHAFIYDKYMAHLDTW